MEAQEVLRFRYVSHSRVSDMRRSGVWTVVTLAALIGLAVAFRSPPDGPGNPGSETKTIDSGPAPIATEIRAPGGDEQVPVVAHPVMDAKSKLRDRLMLLGKCAGADALLQAARTSRSAECIGTKDVQKCVDEHNRATNSDPRLSEFRSQLAQCADVSHPGNEIYLTLRAAAENGDQDAQVCFIRGVMSDLEHWEIAGIADVYADYQALTKRYIAAAFARGDWRIIKQFSQERTDISDAALGAIYPYGTPEIAHKMLHLLTLGATGEYAKNLAGRLQDMESAKDFSGNPILTGSQIRDDKEWARTTYDSYYAHSPRLTKEPAALCDWGAR